MQVLVFEVTELPAHALLGGQLPVLPRAWGPDNTGVKKKQVQPERPWAHSLSLRPMPEAWETVLMWAAAWGTDPPEKTLWACYRGRKTGTGTGQAEEKKPHGQSGFSPPRTCPPCAGHT